jgi:hypothetical protein
MFSFLEKIRSKPLAIRKRYALGFCLTVLIILSGVWGTAHVAKIRAAKSPVGENSGPSPFQALKQNISEGYKGIANSISSSNPFTSKENTAAVPEESTSSNGVIISDVK